MVVGVAFAVTALYNRLRVPTSTIQILVFSLAGTALGAGIGVRWGTIGVLAAIWLTAPLVAGTVGGAAMAAGMLSRGRPLLERVAFDIVTLDRPMATAAQAVQAVVVLLAVSFGFFTSMNQALVGAVAGTGVARGRQAVHRSTLTAILRGWLLGPAAGIVVAFVVSSVVVAAGVHLR